MSTISEDIEWITRRYLEVRAEREERYPRNPIYTRMLSSGFIGQIAERYGDTKQAWKARTAYVETLLEISTLERSGILSSAEAWTARRRNARRWHAALLRLYRRTERIADRRRLVGFVMSGKACDRHGRALS